MKIITYVFLTLFVLASCSTEPEENNAVVDSGVDNVEAPETSNSTVETVETVEDDTQVEQVEEDNSEDTESTTDEVIEEDATESIPEVEAIEEVTPPDLSTTVIEGTGAEPFWGLTASGSTLILREPSASWPMLSTTYTWVSMAYSGTLINVTGSGITVELVPSICSNWMSETLYDYGVEMNIWSKKYYWCADAS